MVIRTGRLCSFGSQVGTNVVQYIFVNTLDVEFSLMLSRRKALSYVCFRCFRRDWNINKYKINFTNAGKRPFQKSKDKISLNVVVNNINCFMQSQTPGLYVLNT